MHFDYPVTTLTAILLMTVHCKAYISLQRPGRGPLVKKVNKASVGLNDKLKESLPDTYENLHQYSDSTEVAEHQYSLSTLESFRNSTGNPEVLEDQELTLATIPKDSNDPEETNEASEVQKGSLIASLQSMLKDALGLEGTPEQSEDQDQIFPDTSKDSSEPENTPGGNEDLQVERFPFSEELDDNSQATDLQEDPENRTHVIGLFLNQVGGFLFRAFFGAVFTSIANWFFPFKVIPPPPGLVGVSQLWGGLPHPHHWHHHWGHLHWGPGKWGNGNWGHAYFGPPYSGQTPPRPSRPWEPHPHAHLKRRNS